MMRLHFARTADLSDIIGHCPVCRRGRVVVGRNGDLASYACPDALDAVTGAEQDDRDYEHYRASEIERPVILAAMAEPPAWLLRYTSGRPAYSYATGSRRPLLWNALGERARGQTTEHMAAYREAMDAFWTRHASDLEHGRWTWMPHDDGAPLGMVPDGAVIVCTCKPGDECHTGWLAAHLARSATWTVEV